MPPPFDIQRQNGPQTEGPVDYIKLGSQWNNTNTMPTQRDSVQSKIDVDQITPPPQLSPEISVTNNLSPEPINESPLTTPSRVIGRQGGLTFTVPLTNRYSPITRDLEDFVSNGMDKHF